MGVDLQLLPFSKDHSLTVLQCNRDSDFFEWLKKHLAPHLRDVPEDFACYLSREGDPLDELPSHYGIVTEDNYGDPLKYVTAGRLKLLAGKDAVSGDWQNRAVWAYLEHIPDDYKVALFWS